MVEFFIGLIIFLAAIQDFFYQKIFDGFSLGIVFFSILSHVITFESIALAFVLLGLSFVPLQRPCWSRGDGLLLAALSLYYDSCTMIFLIVMSTIVLFILHLFSGLPTKTAIPLAPSLFLAWLVHALWAKFL